MFDKPTPYEKKQEKNGETRKTKVKALKKMPSHPFDTPPLICYSYIQLHSGNEEKSTQRRH